MSSPIWYNIKTVWLQLYRHWVKGHKVKQHNRDWGLHTAHAQGLQLKHDLAMADMDGSAGSKHACPPLITLK